MDAIDRPCSGWNTARKANLSTVVQREWVYGYLSGLSEAFSSLEGKHSNIDLPANEEIVSQLNTYCELHPQATVNQAARRLFDEWVGKR